MKNACVDCKWSTRWADAGPLFIKCNAPDNMEMSAVTGKPERRWVNCSTQRFEPYFFDVLMKSCGKRGRWFQPRDAGP